MFKGNPDSSMLVSPNGSTWYPPTAVFASGPNWVEFGYLPSAFPLLIYGIIVPSTQFTFPGHDLAIPQGGPTG